MIGVSNEGNFLRLVAAARPVRRLIYVNALIPRPGKALIEVCQAEQVPVPDSLLDKLLKASQSVTHGFLKVLHDPNATDVPRKRMRDLIDASPAARAIVGFYEICPLKTLPDVDNVCVSGSDDDQIRPEWEQSAARRVLAVEPVVLVPATQRSSHSMQPSLPTGAQTDFEGPDGFPLANFNTTHRVYQTDLWRLTKAKIALLQLLDACTRVVRQVRARGSIAHWRLGL